MLENFNPLTNLLFFLWLIYSNPMQVIYDQNIYEASWRMPLGLTKVWQFYRRRILLWFSCMYERRCWSALQMCCLLSTFCVANLYYAFRSWLCEIFSCLVRCVSHLVEQVNNFSIALHIWYLSNLQVGNFNFERKVSDFETNWWHGFIMRLNYFLAWQEYCIKTNCPSVNPNACLTYLISF